MTTHDLDSDRSPIDGSEVMFLLLKHRWKLFLCILAGLGAAAYVYFNHQAPYESQAKLLVRYVVERSPIDTVESQTGTSGRNSEGVINSEIEILTSWDLATEVAQAIGPDRLLGYPVADGLTQAAAEVREGLWVESNKGSNVISVGYRNHDAALAVEVLETLLTRYFEKHLSVHRSVGTFEFVAQQKQQVADRLRETEEKLNELKRQAEVISLPEINAAIDQALTRSQTSLQLAEVELAEQLARVNAIEQMLGRQNEENAPEGPQPTQSEIQQYNAIVARLGVLRREGLDLLSRYTPESRLVKMNRDQIRTLDNQRVELERQFPTLAVINNNEGSPFASQTDLLAERARLAAIKGRTEALRAQLAEVRARAEELSQFGPLIAQLERQRLVDEENFKYFEATLERARIDEALDPSKIPNISVVQQPSPATTVVDEQINKQIAMLAGGGAVIGLGLVFLLGFVFDRSVKRPAELHRKLGLNHLLAIPYVKRGSLRALSGTTTPLLTTGGDTGKKETLSKARMEEYVGPYCEAICDRLIHAFQIEGKTHKPKLVAVTSCHTGAGTSTIAAGLAAALSRTGDGKVLLVDMNTRRSDHRYYFGGKHISSLVDVLQEGSTPQPAAENLYLATVSAPTGVGASRPLPVRFHSLLPRLKHSEFDYVIFDMPPADDTSATLAIAGFVDKVFLIIEAERTSREAARRAYTELQSMRADTSILVNKTRHYGPRWLNLEN